MKLKILGLAPFLFVAISCGPQGPRSFEAHLNSEERIGVESAHALDLSDQISSQDSGKSVGADMGNFPTPAQEPQSFALQGELTPSIYYQPLLSDHICSTSEKVPMYGPKATVLIRVCPRNLNTCAMEGSCRISQDGVVRSFNISGEAGGRAFFEVHQGDCLYGYGVNSICLDPFYTVAADFHYYHPGDVIYVPALVGGRLPNGRKHHGFLVVRDRGGGIHGPNRFDFFSGSLDWQNPDNLFGTLRFSDNRTHVPYYKVSRELAQRILTLRSYPQLPEGDF